MNGNVKRQLEYRERLKKGLVENPTNKNFKNCLECGEVFRINGSHPNQKGFCCLFCYRKNTNRQKESLRKIRMEEIKRWCCEQFGYKCSRCGLVDKEHLEIWDFHHKEGRKGDKRRMRELMFKWFLDKKIPDDIIMLNSDCHRIVTHSEAKDL
jgi:hypothetical protein